MNSAVNELVKSVIDKNSLSECDITELQTLVQQFPYFGPAQFLLAQKLKEDNSPLYEQQSQKAVLYFPDHLWFNYLFATEDTGGTILPIKTAEPRVEEPVAAPVAPPPPVEQPLAIIEIPIEPLTGEDYTESEEEEEENEEELVPLPEFKIKPIEITGKEFTFEPFHTVDYFASQGILIKEEEKPKDRFTQQLKSFTEWLKTMKRLPETEIPVAPAVPDDQKVTQMAERSISDREVVTEAMAEVWEKQGNHQKAIEIYRKLSLLDPSKSSYFAAKIDHLKTL